MSVCGSFRIFCRSIALMLFVPILAESAAWAGETQVRHPAEPYASIYENPSRTSTTGSDAVKISAALVHKLAETLPGDSVKAWVFFRDKGISSWGEYEASVIRVSSTYNRRAVERRARRRTLPGLFDEHDLPVVPAYIAEVEATGAQVHVRSRWLNAVSIFATEQQVERINTLPFVKSLELVRRGRRVEPAESEESSSGSDAAGDARESGSRAFYGIAEQQLTQINLPAVHGLGFTGKNVIIGLLDSSFTRIHDAFQDPTHPVKVIAEWDFVGDDPITALEPGDPGFSSHGGEVLGIIGAYMPDDLVGGAYDASFVLCRTEDDAAEYKGEEDNYIAGLEFIEAHGADMSSASISYLRFDDPSDNYTQRDLDGQTALMTIAVNQATANGMHCCNSPSNSGHDDDPETSHLDAPADAFDLIAVGSVSSTGDIAGSSPDGPTWDGRVKPEVLARGVATQTVHTTDPAGFISKSGTSFSTPLVASAVACLIQAYPDWTPQKMREALFTTADYYVANGTFDPLYVRGYGVIDTLAALRADCNDNDIDDLMDISSGSADCNANDIPDECEADCDDNGTIDACETFTDCNGNERPDECDADCNEDGTPDDCETDVGEMDCDGDGVCDGVQITGCAPGDLSCADCNENGVPDWCDVRSGYSPDVDSNHSPDECSPPPAPAAPPHDTPKNRYISLDPTTNGLVSVALEVQLTSMLRCSGDLNLSCGEDADCDSGTGPCVEHPQVGTLLGWVAEPWDASCTGEDGTPNGNECTGQYVARIESTPTFRVWSENPLHIGDCETVPVATFSMRFTADEVIFSQPLSVGTIPKAYPWHYGDTVGVGTGALPPEPGFTAPNQIVNVNDVTAYLLTAQGDTTPSVHPTWVDLHGLGDGAPPNYVLNVSDLQRILFGLEGAAYAEASDQYNPADCP
ncbi:MAG: S8 family serine peptidase [Phycisphaerales bacterium]|nr:MAG: S8 family serine peptidase [Phycisphaerales bacterium]